MANKDLHHPYLHKQVSLLSTSDVRYDGRLYVVDNDANTLALQHVKCMGTEGRRGGEHAIAPSDCMYEFIIFRAENIKKLYVVEDSRLQDITDEILEPLQSKPVRQGDIQQHSSYSHSGTSATRGGRHGAGSASRAATARTTRSNEEHAPLTYERMPPYFSQTARSSGLQPVEDPQAHLSQHNGRETTAQIQMHKRKVGIKKQAPYVDSRAKYDYGYYNDYAYPAQTNHQSHYASRAPRQTKTRSYANYGYSDDGFYDTRYQYRGNSATKKITKDQNNAIRNNNYRKSQGFYVNNYKRSQVAQQRQSPVKVKKYPAPRKPSRNKQETATARAGTGEYLERRQLVGSEIEVPKEDLDFAASLAKLESTRENESKKQSEEKEANGSSDNKNEKQLEEKKTTENQSQQVASAKPEDTVTITHGKRAYDKDSFFDQLNLNTTKKENAKEKTEEPAPVAVEEEHRNLDVETFGSVAEQYRFAARPIKASKNAKTNLNPHNKRQSQYKQSAKNKQYRPQQSRAEKAPKKSQSSTKKGQKSQKLEYRSRRVIWQPREQNSNI